MLPLLLRNTAAALLLSSICIAETVKDREGAVRNDRASLENDPRWIYNDFERGFAEAKTTGKPLLVVLRCVPCLACAGLDGQIAVQEPELRPLLDQFVCVRLINANTLDLARFQFDYDLSFSTLFFNADGTVYGRYGSWKHQRDPQDKTTAGFRRTLEAVLDLHRAYPAQNPALAGKQGVSLPFSNPLEMPSISGKYPRELDWGGKVVQSCVHCHQVGDAYRASLRAQKQVIPQSWIYPSPAPETIGLHLAPDQIAQIDSVEPNSPAAHSGLRAGDEILALGGQRLVSLADVSWALNSAPDSGNFPATIRRAGAEQAVTISLPDLWRRKSDISRRVGTWQMRAMAFGGLVLEDLPSEERARRTLPENGMALLVKHLGQYGQHAAAKNAGFAKDDIVVEMDGLTSHATEGELLGHLLQNHQIGETVSATVLRGDKRLTFKLPMQ